MKSIIFWDIPPYDPLNVCRRFGGTYHLYLQGQRISWATELVTCSHTGFLLGLFFDPEDGGDVPLKRRLTFNGLHGVISQMMAMALFVRVCSQNITA
jgi:hypothetical protein